jgi:hypothetical protein
MAGEDPARSARTTALTPACAKRSSQANVARGVNSNGPVVPRPKSDVPTALPVVRVNAVGGTGSPSERAW